ncbi:MAG: OmpA family protein [Hyphomicrobiales bacterium]|nr:OmpA family protein [Hyphomicrobiales bacterium]
MPEMPPPPASRIAKFRHLLLATTVISAIALPQIVNAFDATAGSGRIIVAQKEDPKKKKDQQPQPKPQPKAVQQPQQQQPKPKVVQPPPQQQPKTFQQPKTVQPPPQKPQPKVVQPPPQQQPKTFQQPKTVQPPPQKPQPKVVQPPPQQQPKTFQQPKTVQPPPQQPQPKVVQPPPQQPQPKVVQPPQQKLDPKGPAVVTPAPKNLKVETPKFAQPKAPPPGPRNVSEIKTKREPIKQGNLVVIREPGNRLIVRDNNRLVIRNDDSLRMRRWGNAKFEVRGTERFTIVRRGSYEIVTVTDANGHLLRRYRRGFDGREYVLIDNRRRLGVGVAVVGGVALLALAAPVITMPRERYVVGVETAPPVLLYETLSAPPVAPLARGYTLDEIRDNVELRDHMRSVDINTINFASGSWEVSPDQIPQLQALAEAMMNVINENPTVVFLIEGHTDAVGAPEDNLSLSDRRAEAVAEILTTNFQVPPENLVTQGYGEQHLKLATQGPSRENRRVVVRNITPLMAGQDGLPPDAQPPG